jgi:starch phosphorylase
MHGRIPPLSAMNDSRTIAYFSMEIGIAPEIPTYSGGLGVLSGDTIRSAADIGLPMVGVSLLYRKGFFKQTLDASGWQHEGPVEWPVEEHFTLAEPRVFVVVEGRAVCVRAWTRDVVGVGGRRVPLVLLDTDMPGNDEVDRGITYHLYGGDQRYRLCQEVVLGLGGMRMLRALGYDRINRYHMNEGHPALLTLDLLEEQAMQLAAEPSSGIVVSAVRDRCVFTTHTPVAAGHDAFEMGLFEHVAGTRAAELARGAGAGESVVNMTRLAMNLSHYTNGVAKKHGEVSRAMLGNPAVDAITNGIHAPTWACRPMAELFDRVAPLWRQDSAELRRVAEAPDRDLVAAHWRAKHELLERVQAISGVKLDRGAFTIGFARRATGYKRPDLVLSEPERLARIARDAGPVQIVFAGKAHPRDGQGKEIIARIHSSIASLKGKVEAVFLPNYGMELGGLITAGVDLWLNNPEPPLEASGTSGMKAALNGVPSLSTLDGWWIEGCLEGRTGWAIAPETGEDRNDLHAGIMYEKLERAILPVFYQRPEAWAGVMRNCIAINGAYFNTQRMVEQYAARAYLG